VAAWLLAEGYEAADRHGPGRHPRASARARRAARAAWRAGLRVEVRVPLPGEG